MIYRMNMRGRYHAVRNEECGDALFSAEEHGYRICVLADGVSSCADGAKGARVTAAAAGNILTRKSEHFMGFDGDEIKKHILSHVRHELERSAAEAKETPEQLYQWASTLSAAVYDQRSGRMLYLNLGDSLIMIIKGESYEFPAKPCLQFDGASATTVTEEGMYLAEAGVTDASDARSVLLCSDGAWRMMFDNHAMKPEVLTMLLKKEPDRLEKYLVSKNPADDCSFLFIDTEG